MTETFIAWGAAAAVLALVAMLLGAVAIKRGPLGILIDERGRYSLTQFQLATWTIVVLSLIFGVFWGRLRSGNNGALNFSIPSQVLLLLGISLSSTVVATTIKSVKDASHARSIAASNADDKPRFSQVFLVEEGTLADKVIDITKFQSFWITVILSISYVALAIDAIHNAKSPDKLTTLPGFSSQFITLLAISHGGYIIGKVPNKPGDPAGLTFQKLTDGATPTDPPKTPAKSATYVPRNP